MIFHSCVGTIVDAIGVFLVFLSEHRPTVGQQVNTKDISRCNITIDYDQTWFIEF